MAIVPTGGPEHSQLSVALERTRNRIAVWIAPEAIVKAKLAEKALSAALRSKRSENFLNFVDVFHVEVKEAQRQSEDDHPQYVRRDLHAVW